MRLSDSAIQRLRRSSVNINPFALNEKVDNRVHSSVLLRWPHLQSCNAFLYHRHHRWMLWRVYESQYTLQRDVHRIGLQLGICTRLELHIRQRFGKESLRVLHQTQPMRYSRQAGNVPPHTPRRGQGQLAFNLSLPCWLPCNNAIISCAETRPTDVEHVIHSIQLSDRRRVRRTLSGDLRVRQRLLEDRHISFSQCRVSYDCHCR